jgi:hypothetical protein
MFRITAETCHAFTLAQILILAAMNVKPSDWIPHPQYLKGAADWLLRTAPDPKAGAALTS